MQGIFQEISALPDTGSEVHRAVPVSGIAPPFAAYNHGIDIAPGARLVLCSGQLGMDAAGGIPADCEAQAELCFANIAAILDGAGLTLRHVVRINAFVTDRAHMAAYMRVRDRLFAGHPPASTLMIVGGFTREEFLVEIEVIAAGPPAMRADAAARGSGETVE